jgi:hypothetical protein
MSACLRVREATLPRCRRCDIGKFTSPCQRLREVTLPPLSWILNNEQIREAFVSFAEVRDCRDGFYGRWGPLLGRVRVWTKRRAARLYHSLRESTRVMSEKGTMVQPGRALSTPSRSHTTQQ